MIGEPNGAKVLVCDIRLWFGKAAEVTLNQSRMVFKHAFLPPTSFRSTSLTLIPGTYHLYSLKPGTKHKTDKKSIIRRLVYSHMKEESSCHSNIQKSLPCRTNRNENLRYQCVLSLMLSPEFSR